MQQCQIMAKGDNKAYEQDRTRQKEKKKRYPGSWKKGRRISLGINHNPALRRIKEISNPVRSADLTGMSVLSRREWQVQKAM